MIFVDDFYFVFLFRSPFISHTMLLSRCEADLVSRIYEKIERERDENKMALMFLSLV